MREGSFQMDDNEELKQFRKKMFDEVNKPDPQEEANKVMLVMLSAIFDKYGEIEIPEKHMAQAKTLFEIQAKRNIENGSYILRKVDITE